MTPEKAIEIAIHCLGVQAEQEVCEECPAYLEGGITCREAARTAISALKEIQQYREIGTVEECREAVEKQKPKKPIPINHQDYADKIAYAEFLQDSYFCPYCKTVLRSGSHCNRCGQKLNWNENLEGMEMYQDGVPVYVLPNGAYCKADEERRSPIDLEDCPVGHGECVQDCYFYGEE